MKTKSVSVENVIANIKGFEKDWTRDKVKSLADFLSLTTKSLNLDMTIQILDSLHGTIMKNHRAYFRGPDTSHPVAVAYALLAEIVADKFFRWIKSIGRKKDKLEQVEKFSNSASKIALVAITNNEDRKPNDFPDWGYFSLGLMNLRLAGC